MESGYDKADGTFQAYDGRSLKGFLYTAKPGPGQLEKDLPPSARYLGVLVKGAQQAGLKPAYVQ